MASLVSIHYFKPLTMADLARVGGGLDLAIFSAKFSFSLMGISQENDQIEFLGWVVLA